MLAAENDETITEIKKLRDLNEQNEKILEQLLLIGKQEKDLLKHIEKEMCETQLNNEKLAEEVKEKTAEIKNLRDLTEQYERKLEKTLLVVEQKSILIKRTEEEKCETQLRDEELSKSLNMLAADREERITEIALLRDLNKQYEEKLAQVEKELSTSLEMNCNYQKSFENFNIEIDLLKETNNHIREKLKGEEILNLNLSQTQSELKNSKENNLDKDKEIEQLRKQMRDSKKIYYEEVNKFKKQIESNEIAYEKNLTSLSQEKKKLQEDINFLTRLNFKSNLI